MSRPLGITEIAMARIAAERLQRVVSLKFGELTPADHAILRAAANHAGHEAAARLYLPWHGERVQPHDRFDWVEMLTYWDELSKP